MVGCVGDDAAGEALLAGLARAGVDTAPVRVLAGETSGTAVIVVDGAGENSIVVVAGANGRLAAADVEAAVAGAAIVLVQLEIPEAAVAAAARGAARLVLNASPVRALADDVLAAADPLIVNAGEAAALAEAGRTRIPDALAAALLARGARSVVVTLGADGARWTTPEGTLACPAPAVEVVDTTGRGRRVRRHARRASSAAARSRRTRSPPRWRPAPRPSAGAARSPASSARRRAGGGGAAPAARRAAPSRRSRAG